LKTLWVDQKSSKIRPNPFANRGSPHILSKRQSGWSVASPLLLNRPPWRPVISTGSSADAGNHRRYRLPMGSNPSRR
jgi:hypothetical protein